jgi:hypothetical protein
MYRFCIRNPDGSIAASCEMEVQSDTEACEIGRGLVIQAAFPNIEVWRGDAKIYSLAGADEKDPSH